ncbi:MAG: glycerophosphodiester phosphodiesterase [FCB group bacterium]|nr:glycerophosphodiester phosphodiesterase [FCB group bacterium]
MVFGHRGAAGYEPENTLRSFSKALSLGAKWVELDVYSVENELLVFHDERLERTTGGTGYIQTSSLEYLRSLDAGKGEKIPFLSEVIELTEGRAGINIELKGENSAEPVVEIIEKSIAARKWKAGQFLVSSFNHHELASFKKLIPQINIGALVSHIPLNYARFAEELQAFSIHANREFISEEFVRDTHRRGMKFYVYTVNHPEDVLRLRKMHIDGIFTDYPDLSISDD